MLPQHPLHDFVVERLGSGAQLGRQVLLVLEEQPAVRRVVQVPSPRRQLVENVGLERGEVPTWSLKAVHQLVVPYPMDGSRSRGEGCHQNQPGGIRGVTVAVRLVDQFHLGVAVMSDVVGDGFAEAWVDRAHLGGDLVLVEVEVVGVDQIEGAGFSGVPEVGYDHLHQSNHATGLLKAFVLLELAHQLPQIGMERVGVLNSCSKRDRICAG